MVLAAAAVEAELVSGQDSNIGRQGGDHARTIEWLQSCLCYRPRYFLGSWHRPGNASAAGAPPFLAPPAAPLSGLQDLPVTHINKRAWRNSTILPATVRGAANAATPSERDRAPEMPTRTSWRLARETLPSTESSVE